MTGAFDLASLLPGTHRVALPYGRGAAGSELHVPVVIMAGVRSGPRVVVTAGIHGDEFEGVRALAELSRELDATVLNGTLVLVPIANPPAFHAGTRTSPLDGVNLNRVFPGDPGGTLSERLAHALFTHVIAGADMLIDLHSGGTRYLFHPQAGFYTVAGALGERSLAMARAFGLDLLWDLPHRSGVCSYEAVRAGVPAIGVEIGGGGRCEPEHVALARRGVARVLALNGLLPVSRDSLPAQRIWRGDFTRCPAGGLFHSAVSLGQDVAAGQLLYTVLDAEGRMCYQHHAPHAGLVAAIRAFAAIQEGEWDISVLRRADV